MTISGMSGSLTNSTPISLSILKMGQINHVVIIFQENRTPDNLFHDQNLINAGADIASTGKTSTGATVTLTPVPLVTTYDLGHSHTAFLSTCQWNGTQCAMNGADLEPCSGQGCPAQNAAYQYVQASDVQPYFDLAEAYTFGDRMFQTNEGPSFPAHQYILSGTSAVCVPGGNCPSGMTSTFYVADNPSDNERADGAYGAGCLAPPDSLVNIIDTSQPFPNKALSHITGPECFEHPTLTDVLDANGLQWKYYAALPGDIWTAPNVIEHMCQPSGPANDNNCSGPDWTAPDPKVVIEGSGSQVTQDIQNGQLAAVTWVIPTGANSDHAAGNDGGGPSWVASIVNTIGASQFWSDTAIIITWDDWGGWYDHVAPQIRNTNSYEYGFRVPLIVVSPYAKQKYVSHQVNDFGSILKFIEEVFSLPEIDPSVGYADSYAVGDLSDCFDFSQSPQPFTQIKAPLKTEYFQNSKAPATPPDND
ncbi:MAG: alkaline phosphatase family protein [Terriglobales bacterium]